MDCSCGIYFWYGIMTALLPSFIGLALLLGLTKRRDNDHDDNT